MNSDNPPSSVTEQALDAARDDLSLTDLANLLSGLPSLYYVQVEGDDEEWRPTEIAVNFDDDAGRGTEDVLTIMRRAGWRPVEACFARNRVTFREVGADGE